MWVEQPCNYNRGLYDPISNVHFWKFNAKLRSSIDSFHGDVDSILQWDSSGVSVPSTSSPLSGAKEDELKALVDPLQDSSNYAIELYDQVRLFVSDNTQ